MIILDWIVVVLFFGFNIFLIYSAGKSKKMDEFAVGSRQIPGIIVFASLTSTIIGPGYTMGIANKAAQDGYIWMIIFSAFALQTIINGYFVAPKLREFNNAITLADIMGERYGKLVKIISGIFSVAICIGFFGAIARATGDIISFTTGIPFLWALIFSTTFIVIYSAIGGIKSIVLTDVFQFIILIVSIPLALLFMGNGAGIDTLINSTPNELFNLTGHFPVWTVLGLFLGFLLGETLIPPYTIRALMAKDSKQAKSGFLISGFYMIIWFFVCASIGILGLSIYPESQNVFLDVLKNSLPAGITGLAIAGLLSIIMSSQSSIINTASVSFSNDILSEINSKVKNEKILLFFSRWLNVVIGGLAIFFAINVPGVVEALLICYTLWASTIVLPLIIGALYKKAKPLSALIAIILGGVATGIWEWGLSNPYEIPSVLVGITANQIGFWLTQMFFSYQPKNTWLSPITNIGE